jgi:SAM-dependent methyltransferase
LPDATNNLTATTRSLDLGCGSAPELPDAGVQVGLDIDLPSLQASRRLYPQVHFVCGDGEQLPFRDGTFDAVVSRVALPLMNLNAAIPEISRVLKPEGRATLNLHQFGFAWRDFLRRVRSGHPQAIIGGLWAMVNGCIFHFFGRTLRFPFSRRFYDSFQTYSSMTRILHNHGFSGRVIEAYVIKTWKREEPRRDIS